MSISVKGLKEALASAISVATVCVDDAVAYMMGSGVPPDDVDPEEEYVKFLEIGA